jgi:hypothetical protein
LDQNLQAEKSSADEKLASPASAVLTDPINIIDQLSASPCSESVSYVEKPELLPQTAGVLVRPDDQSSSQSSVINPGWLDCKPAVGEVIPVDLQAMFVDGCQLFISPSTMNDDVSSAVFVEMDTNSGSVTASASSDAVPVAAVGLQSTLPDQFTLTLDHSPGSDAASLPVLIHNDNIEVMLRDGSAATVHSGLDSSVIACPIITTCDSLASVRVTTLPSSGVVLFSSTCPAPSTPAIVSAGAYQVIQDVNQLSAAFPSPCTPSTSDVAFASMQELTVPQVTNPFPGTPGVLHAACQSHAAVDQLSVSFPTPQTPGQPQLTTPTGANYFKFSAASGGLTSGRVDTLPQTPVYTVAFTQSMMGRQLFSPRTPYTPATPSIFQFPPTASAVHESAGKCSSPFIVQKHLNNYHPYGQPAALELSSPHFQRLQQQQQAAIRKAEERKKFEQDVAEAHLEIEHHLKQLQQEDMIKQLLKSESQVRESRPDTGSQLNIPANNVTSNTVPTDLRQRVDDVFQVLAEEAEDMDTCSGFSGTSHHTRTECLAVNTQLQSGASEVWIVQNSAESLKKMKRKQKPEPLVIPDSMSNFKHVTNQVIYCQMPAVRDIISGSLVTPYTPPPMRSPLWTGLAVNKTMVNLGVPLSAPPYKSTESGEIICSGELGPSFD